MAPPLRPALMFCNRLYALKPDQELKERVLINTLKKDAKVLYDMNYESILQYLERPRPQALS